MSPMKFCLPSKRINYDWASLIQSYKQYVSPSSTVLEIGASNLERTKELCGYCRKLIGLELLPERTPQDFDNVKYLTGDWQNAVSYTHLRAHETRHDLVCRLLLEKKKKKKK